MLSQHQLIVAEQPPQMIPEVVEFVVRGMIATNFLADPVGLMAQAVKRITLH